MSINQLHDRAGVPLSDSALAIAMGAVPGVKHINKFGTNHDISTTYEYIWVQGNGWTQLPATTLLEVASTSALDVMTSGTGAWTITIEGLDDDGVEITDIVELNGQTPVLTALQFSFVNRAYVSSCGTGEVNAGIVRIADDSTSWSVGVPVTTAAIQAMIDATHGQTQQMIYKVPSTHWLFTTRGYITADSSKVVTYRFYLMLPGTNCRRIGFEGTLSSGDTVLNFNPYFGPVPPGSIIYADAIVDVGNAAVSAGLDFILVENKYMT